MRPAIVPMSACIAVLVAACAYFDSPTDYNRHRLTTITVPHDRTDIFYYDVTITAEFPADDPAAEAERLHWLDLWMKVRNMCPAGTEVLKRRPYAYNEDNPGHYDLRYEVRCKPGPVDKKSTEKTPEKS